MGSESGQVDRQLEKAVRERCERCAGTGLVCGHTPVIGSGSCCVDYANAVCPDCNGKGVKGEPSGECAE
jgi:hypothetical protein